MPLALLRQNQRYNIMKQQKQPLHDQHLALKLCQELQANLDIDVILARFSSALSSYVRHSGVQLAAASMDGVALQGEEGFYRESIKLVDGEEPLGAVTMMRQSPIVHWEATLFADLAKHLLYPVKHALLVQGLRLQMVMDPLTQAFNRTTLEHDLGLEVERSARYNTPFVVVMIDIDHFKQVNDRYGHAAGDQVLKGMSCYVKQQIRNSDSLYRYGGEEFMLLLRNTTLQRARQRLEKLLDHFRGREWSEVEVGLQITLSAGVASWTSGESVQSLIEQADQALYLSKANGRDQITVAA